MKKRRRKTAAPKRRNAPKVARHRNPAAHDPNKKLRCLTRERDEAAGAADRHVRGSQNIGRSAGDLNVVFDAMLEKAVRICEASFGVLFQYSDDTWRADAMFGVPPAFAEFWNRGPTAAGPANRAWPPRRHGRARSYRRRHQRTGLCRERANLRRCRRPRALSHDTQRSPAQGNRSHRRVRDLPPRGWRIHRETDRVREKLRRSGRHRHREYAIAQRTARSRWSNRPRHPKY